MIVSGSAIAAVWMIDIITNPNIDKSQGLLKARDVEEGRLMIP